MNVTVGEKAINRELRGEVGGETANTMDEATSATSDAILRFLVCRHPQRPLANAAATLSPDCDGI